MSNNLQTLISNPQLLLEALSASPAALEAIGELKTLTAAYAVADGSFKEMVALSVAIGDLIDPASMPPAPAAGVSLDTLAKASCDCRRLCSAADMGHDVAASLDKAVGAYADCWQVVA